MKEKEIKVLKVKPHEHPEVYMLKNTLEAMQEAVGGYIDIVGLDDNVCILLNDEGKLIGLEGNRRIGKRYHRWWFLLILFHMVRYNDKTLTFSFGE